MTVDPPITDEIFAEPDEQLARAMNMSHTDLVAEAMTIYSCSFDDAEDRVLNEPMKTKAEIVRYWDDTEASV
jgi:hypothetical protein